MSTVSPKIKELIAIGASIGCNCHSCLEFHLKAAKEAGAGIEEIKEAIEIGEMVKETINLKTEVLSARLLTQ